MKTGANHVAFMLHGAAVCSWQPLKINGTMLQFLAVDAT
jgi:hypothetical protein